MNINKKKKIILAFVVLTELIAGSVFLLNFYQRKIVHRTQDPDKISVIKKENLIFPEESEYQYYWELKPNTTVIDEPDWLGYQAQYTYNADGLNERSDYEIEKPANTFRIVTLGDSFTFGLFVNTKDNWPEQLEDLLNESSLKSTSHFQNFEVINLGMQAFDVPYLVKRYENIGAKYKPDLIIWFESSSGFDRLLNFMEPIIDDCEKKKTDNNEQNTISCWLEAENQIKDNRKAEVDKIIINSFDDFYSITDNSKVLMFGFEEDILHPTDLKTLNMWRSRYPDINFLFSVPDLYDRNQYLPDGHPNVDGHHTIAVAIFDYLKNNLFKDYE